MQLNMFNTLPILLAPQVHNHYPPNNTYFACASGLSPHIIPSQFLSSHDYCVLALLLPKLSVHPTEDLLLARPGTARHHRGPVTAITVAILLALRTGIYSLVSSQQNFDALQRSVQSDILKIKNSLQYLTDTITSLAKFSPSKPSWPQFGLFERGGVCAALKEECCIFKDETGLVRDSIKRIENSLEERRRTIDQSESWYKNWFATTPWLSTLLPAFLGPFIGFLLLISFGPWAFRKLTNFVKNQIDEATKKNPHILYQQLSTTEDPLNAPDDAPKPLKFEVFEQLANRPPSVCSRLARLWRRLAKA